MSKLQPSLENRLFTNLTKNMKEKHLLSNSSNGFKILVYIGTG